MILETRRWRGWYSQALDARPLTEDAAKRAERTARAVVLVNFIVGREDEVWCGGWCFTARLG